MYLGFHLHKTFSCANKWVRVKIQEFVEGCYILNFNGNPVQQRGIKRTSDFSEIKIDIDRKPDLEEDNEEATCSQEILIVNATKKTKLQLKWYLMKMMMVKYEATEKISFSIVIFLVKIDKL